MMKASFLYSVAASILLVLAMTDATSVPPETIRGASVSYIDPIDDANLTGYAVTVTAVEGSAGKPAIVIIPDWDGITEYEQQRATLIADTLGYDAFVADIYAVPVVADDERFPLLDKYRNKEPALYMARIRAAVQYVTDNWAPSQIALAGYCFGGSGVLMYAINNGAATAPPVAAVVSFHGGLGPHIWNHDSNLTAATSRDGHIVDDGKTSVLVLSGGEDDMATDIITLEDTLDASNATVRDWEITRYEGIQHGFTVWSDTRYNAWADERSWESMILFLQKRFGEMSFDYDPPVLDLNSLEAIPYTDPMDGKELQSYLAKPDPEKWMTPSPAVIIIPDWDGVNEYEQQRAQMYADLGYVAFAADIYGADLQANLSFDQRVEQATLYRSQNVSLFESRMQLAVDTVKAYDFVKSDAVAMIGYCFGGTGVVQYAFSGTGDVQLVAAYHGNVQEDVLPKGVSGANMPYVMVLSGGEDDAHGNQTFLEESLNANMGMWEISRYSGVFHGFTSWSSPAYNLNADFRSWTAMLTAMDEQVGGPVKVASEVTTDGDEPGPAPVPVPEDPATAPVPEPSPEEPTSGDFLLSSSALVSLSLVLVLVLVVS